MCHNIPTNYYNTQQVRYQNTSLVYPATVRLNVGGEQFRTTYETIKESKYLVNLLDDSLMPNRTIVNEKDVFVDRSSTLFRSVLYFLRTGIVLADDTATLQKLQTEAEFYQIKSMANALKEVLRPLASTGQSIVHIQAIDVADFSASKYINNNERPIYLLNKITKNSEEKSNIIDYVPIRNRDGSTSHMLITIPYKTEKRR